VKAFDQESKKKVFWSILLHNEVVYFLS